MLLFAGSDRGDGTGRDGRRGRVGFEAVVVVLCFMLCLWVYRMVGGG